jgi:S-formylglutathione hydrolase FrmB
VNAPAPRTTRRSPPRGTPGRAQIRAAAALAALLVCLAAPAGARAFSDGFGLKVLAAQQLDSRLLDITLSTHALAKPTHLRVLLPAGYSASESSRYPVLYLLHGALDDYKSWTAKGDAERITAGLPLIVVMPDAGGGGWYTDWVRGGAGGVPEWESYHVHELIPWIDANFRTRATRDGRAVAGLSMGGFGAMTYAARHPDLFSYAASFSGAVDSNDPELWPIVQFEAVHDGGTPDAIFGPRATDEVIWRGHNPWDLAANLRGMGLAVYTGNGQKGPYDTSLFDPIEAGVHTMSVSFHNRLDALGIPHVWDDYGPGQHAWPYWQRDLRQTLPAVMSTFAHPALAPRTFTYTAIEPGYAVYGWTVKLSRPVLEFSTLEGRPGGFALGGSGSATVTTPARYRPRAVYRVVAVAQNGSRVSRRVRAGRGGRLVVPVTLGPVNANQQYTPQSLVTGTTVRTTQVSISPARR